MKRSDTKKQFLICFKASLRQGLPLMLLFAAAALGWCAFIFIDFFLKLNRHSGQYFIGYNNVIENLNKLIFCITVFGPALLSLIQFKYLYKRDECDLYHALPLRRSPMFFGKLLGAMVCIWIPMIIAGIAAQAQSLSLLQVDGPYKAYFGVFNLLYIMEICLRFMLISLAAYGLCNVCTLLADSLVSAIVYMAVFFSAGPLIVLFGWQLMESAIPGLAVIPGISVKAGCALFSPIAMAIRALRDNQAMGFGYEILFYMNWQSLLYMVWILLFGLIMVFAGVKMFAKKRTELSRGDYAKSKALVALLGAAMAGMVVGIGLSYNSYSTPMFFAGVMLASLLAYVAIQLIFFRSLREWKKRLLPYLIFPVLFVAFTSITSFGLGLDLQKPKMEELLCADLDENSHWGTFLTSEGATLENGFQGEDINNIFLLQDAIIKYFRAESYPYAMGSNKQWFKNDEAEYLTLRYEYKNRGSVYRSYIIPKEPRNPAAQNALDELKLAVKNIRSMEEYVSSVELIAAIDAADTITTAADYNRANQKAYQVDYGYEGEDSLQLEFDAQMRISDMANEADFRKKLEEALRLDFIENGLEYYGEEKGSYVLCYEPDRDFTARGGNIDGKSAKGNTYRLNRQEAVYIDPQMENTYALINEIYNANVK